MRTELELYQRLARSRTCASSSAVGYVHHMRTGLDRRWRRGVRVVAITPIPRDRIQPTCRTKRNPLVRVHATSFRHFWVGIIEPNA